MVEETRSEGSIDEVDVVVLGSGCAGLTAALSAAAHGATVHLLEQASTIGGMTAISAGIVWVPAHHRLSDLALTTDDALQYLLSQSYGVMDPQLVESFVCTAEEMLDFVEARTPLRFSVVPGITDHRPDLPGGKPNGRSLVATGFEPAGLGSWQEKLTTFDPHAWAGFDPATGSRRGGHAGATLVAGLLQGLLDIGVTPQTGARSESLVCEDGAVVGVRFATDGVERCVRARRGVIIATGGFEWDELLVGSFLRGPMHHAAWPPFGRGDGLRMAMAVGADLANMGEAWWVPVVDVEDDVVGGRPRGWGFLFERTQPRSILINGEGQRFVDEAADSTSIAGAFHYFHPRKGYVNDRAWLVFDAEHLRRFAPFGITSDGDIPEWFNESPDLVSLARRAGIDAMGLGRTIERWNTHVRDLRDPDFERGADSAGTWAGDKDAGTAAERTLGPIDQPPYYAVPAAIGALATKGGPRTDVDGRVRHVHGGTIPGLYAAGNAMAVVTGKAYGGLGGTMGPAMTFGYRAGRAAATTEHIASARLDHLRV
jgi:succinate dehydrogenase/fumarate reductase flavoprotein subunit